MIRYRVRPRLGALALVLAACTSDSPTPPPVTQFGGIYDYAALGPTDAPILAGTLTVTARGESLSGDWRIARAPGADTTQVVGPQVGSGTLAGTYDGDSFGIDLTPGAVDNNVELAGTVAGGIARGTWRYIGFAGIIASGPFVARPR